MIFRKERLELEATHNNACPCSNWTKQTIGWWLSILSPQKMLVTCGRFLAFVENPWFDMARCMFDPRISIFSAYSEFIFWLVGGPGPPLWKIWKSIGMMKFPTEWENKKCAKPPTSLSVSQKGVCAIVPWIYGYPSSHCVSTKNLRWLVQFLASSQASESIVSRASFCTCEVRLHP